MNNEKYKRLSINEFNAAAEKFDDNDPSVYNMCRKDYPDLIEELEKEAFTHVLDCGCGTGAMLAMIYKKYPDKQYVGLDLSPKMIEVANRRRKKNLVFKEGDCEVIPFKDEFFDVVMCSMSFHHYPNPELFFKNLARVLKPNGRFILRDMASSSKIMMWLFNHVEIPVMNKIAKKGDVHVYTEDEIRALCQLSGLVLESYELRNGFRLHCVCRKHKEK